MNVTEEDSLDTKQVPEDICLTTEELEFETVMETATDICDRYCNAMKELAK